MMHTTNSIQHIFNSAADTDQGVWEGRPGKRTVLYVHLMLVQRDILCRNTVDGYKPPNSLHAGECSIQQSLHSINNAGFGVPESQSRIPLADQNLGGSVCVRTGRQATERI